MGSAVTNQKPPRFLNAVREARKKRGWSREELARRSSTTTRTIKLIEAGDHNPTAETMLRIWRAFTRVEDLAFSWLFWPEPEQVA